MYIIDAFLRFSGIGLLLMLAVLTVMNFRKWKSAHYLILTCLSVSALFLGFAPAFVQPSGLLYIAVRLLDIPHLVLLWLFALSLFKTDFDLKLAHVLIGAFYCVPLVWVRFQEFGWIAENPPFAGYVISFLSLALMVHLCVATLRGRKDDLLDKRRASRLYFVILIAVVTAASAISDPLIPASSEWRFTAKILAIWPAIVWGFIWMTSFDVKAVTFAGETRIQSDLSESDIQLKDKLEHEMNTGLAYKDPRLSIVGLASKLGVTQHRLRSLINQALGYKNFSEFVNTYRLNDVKKALAESKNDHIPILSVALDCGFNSLSSFNRIFKEFEKTTPSEYRCMSQKANHVEPG